ncbi:oxidoreductase [Aspergillus varians]
MLTRSEVRQHSTRQSCWVIINGTVYDLTEFLDLHPGGDDILLQHAGRDATNAFQAFHEEDILTRHLSPEYVYDSSRLVNPHIYQDFSKHLGPAESEISAKESETPAPAQKKVKLSSIISISDFEDAAAQKLPPTSYAFLKTGAEDEYTARWNRDSWKAVRFRPRVLRPIEKIDISQSILGTSFSAPFFICPAGGARLANPEADLCLTRAATRHGVLHWVCNNAPVSQQDMADARAPGQTTYWQIYAMTDLAATEKQIRQAVRLGYKGFALTVDAIRAGKRERDLRVSLAANDDGAEDDEEEEEGEAFAKEPSVKRPPVWSSFDWPSAIKWIRGVTDLPIAIKGIQCWEDAHLCMQYGVHPWLSNHGGRQLDGAPSSVETLISIRQNCPELFDKCEVIVDGGITRGSDVVKALALGATSVGLGRPFLYSITFGDAGASKAIRILKHEVETTMALLGVTSLDQLDPSYVDTSCVQYGFLKSML